MSLVRVGPAQSLTDRFAPGGLPSGHGGDMVPRRLAEYAPNASGRRRGVEYTRAPDIVALKWTVILTESYVYGLSLKSAQSLRLSWPTKMIAKQEVQTDALVVHQVKDDFKLTKITMGPIRPDEVLVEIKFTGVCHTVSEHLPSQYVTWNAKDH